MTRKLRNGATALACAAAIAILGLPSTASALEAYWSGLRNSNWNVGLDPNKEVSNWYRDTEGQFPVRVPDRTAIFAGTGSGPDVVDDATIGKIRVDPDARPFTIAIAAPGRLIVNGAGIVNQSAATPLFHIVGTMTFQGSARLVSVGARSAFFRLVGPDPGFGYAYLDFQGDSKGGDASIETLHHNTNVTFLDAASAQNMEIANRFGNVRFFERSTGGNAELVNHLEGRSEFHSIGPRRDGVVTIGAIRNDGLLYIGDRTSLIVNRDLVLDAFAQGRVRLEMKERRVGSIVVRGKTRLGGDLIVSAQQFDAVAPGFYPLITAPNGLTGRFRAHRLVNFPRDVRPRIAYSGKEVRLIVERK